MDKEWIHHHILGRSLFLAMDPNFDPCACEAIKVTAKERTVIILTLYQVFDGLRMLFFEHMYIAGLDALTKDLYWDNIELTQLA